MNHDFQGGLVVKSLPASAGDTKDTGSSPESGRSPRGGNASVFLLGNPRDRGAWRATIHGVTRESDMV